MSKLFTLLFIFSIALLHTNAYSQIKSLWTEADRKSLIENLERTKFEIISDTQNLTLEKWSFKEDSTKW